MTKRTIFSVMLLALMLALTTTTFAQPCEEWWPPQPCELPVGQSYCLKVCAGNWYDAILLVGNHNNPGDIPQITLTPGCGHNTACDSDPNCTPIGVPVGPLVLGGHPSGWYPDSYFAQGPCFYVLMTWVHTNTWELIFDNVTCSGCFCLSFDYQLSVNLSAGLTAVGGDREIQLNWTTASETNNDRFEIVRGEQVVERVPGLGTSPTGRHYSWTDHAVENGAVYRYTLRGVDASGTVTILGTASATPNAANSATVRDYALLQNYPNPFNPTTNIAFDLVEAGHVSLKVFNPMGMEVMTLANGTVGAGRHTVAMDAKNLPSGLYFYTINIADRFSATRKMLLVK